jgi:superfamily I DNA and/or RNA helicase
MRRLNVAMTRAKARVIIIGDRATLIGMGCNNGDTESRRVWKNLLDWYTEIKLQS